MKVLHLPQEALQKHASTSSPKVRTETTGNNQLKALEEHRKLFGFKPSTTTTLQREVLQLLMVVGYRFTADLVQRGKERLARSYSYLSETPGPTSFFSLQAIQLMKSQLRAKESSMGWQDLVKKTSYLIEMEMPSMSQKNFWNLFQPLRIVVALKS